MYRIIGADQKEYGPVSAEELRRWLAEGRVNAHTFVKAEGTAEWKPFSAFPEFAPEGASAPPPSPPPFSASSAPGGPATETNGMATAGFVLSIMGLCCCGPLFSTLGLIFSCIALGQISQSPRQRGRKLAIAGIIISLLAYLVLGAGLAIFGLHRHHFGHRFDI